MADEEIETSLPPRKLAFIVGGLVQDVLHTNERLAKIFLSQPIVADVTELLEEDKSLNLIGYSYDPESGALFPPYQDFPKV